MQSLLFPLVFPSRDKIAPQVTERALLKIAFDSCLVQQLLLLTQKDACGGAKSANAYLWK